MKIFTCLSVILCLCALGCDDDSNIAPSIAVTTAPIALDSQLVFVDTEHQRAHLLDVGATRPTATTRAVKVPAGASYSERRVGRGHDEVLVLCAGRRDGLDMDAAQAALVAIDGDGGSRTYEFGTTPFNTLKQSDDGRYAILYRNGSDQSRTLNNPNELVVIDLDKEPTADGAVTRKTPDGLGHTLTQVIVSPQLQIVNEERRLLVILSAAEVTLFDLNHLDRRATIVQLDETRQVNPAQVLFGGENATLYVRSQNSDNIFMFRFEDHPGNAGGNDFRPTINALGGGSGPRDMVLFGTGTEQRLLVVASGSSQALVIDPSSSKTYTVKLTAPAEHIQLFDGHSPLDKEVRTRALLYAGDKRNSVTFLDLQAVGVDPEERLEVVALSSEISSVIPLLDPDETVHEMAFLHPKGVTLLNLAERTLTPISSSTSLTNAIFDAEHKRLWVGTAGTAWVGTLDLESGKTDEVLLDADIRSIIPMAAVNRLVVLHDSPIGYATFLNLDQPTRDSAVSVRGYFVSGAFDRSEK